MFKILICKNILFEK